jgi:hypothetical protein
MAQNLKEYLEQNKAEGFRAVSHYFAGGDYVTYYFRNDPCRAQRVDELLTVYLAEGTDELVGCKIKCVKHILETVGNFGITVDDGGVSLGLLFLAGAAQAKDEEGKCRYQELARIAGREVVDRRELPVA